MSEDNPPTEEIPTTRCSNCGKDIETYKMILHERFCCLNVRKCSFCQEPIQKEEYNEHKALKHTEKTCSKCGNNFPTYEYNAHIKTCMIKLKECQYCGLPVDEAELKDHEYQCGSKTKQCEYCLMNVPISEYDLHLQYTCKIKQQFDHPELIPQNNEIIDQNLDKIENDVSVKAPRRKKENWVFSSSNLLPS